MSYIDLLQKIGSNAKLLDCAVGNLAVPEFTVEAPFDSSFGFPPGLMPVWSNGDWPGYIGVWLQWFGRNREPSYARYFVESQNVQELASTFEQFIAWMTYDFWINVPEEDEEEVGAFAESIGLCKASEVGRVFDGIGGLSDFEKLDAFSGGLPDSFRDRYAKPTWFLPFSELELDDQIKSENWENVWYMINSPGWSVSVVRKTLPILRPHADSVLFPELVECWNDAHKGL